MDRQSFVKVLVDNIEYTHNSIKYDIVGVKSRGYMYFTTQGEAFHSIICEKVVDAFYKFS